jgi:hypothetical protein
LFFELDQLRRNFFLTKKTRLGRLFGVCQKNPMARFYLKEGKAFDEFFLATPLFGL